MQHEQDPVLVVNDQDALGFTHANLQRVFESQADRENRSDPPAIMAMVLDRARSSSWQMLDAERWPRLLLDWLLCESGP